MQHPTAFASVALAALTALVSSNAFAQEPPSAASILREAYAVSKNASSEAEYTLIIDKVDTIDLASAEAEVGGYAIQLKAWALNRRGEIAWDRMKTLDDENGKAAVKDFELANKLDPDRWRVKQNVAFVLAANGKLAESEAMFDEVIKSKPDHANAYFNRGELRYEIGKLKEAISDYSRAIELAPSEADFFSSRAHARFQNNEVAGAIEDYRRAMSLDSGNINRAIDLADALQNNARWQEAIQAYKKAINIDPSNLRAQLNFAWLLATTPDARVRDPRQAIQLVQSLKNVPPEEEFRFIDTQAASFAAIGNFQAAVRSATTAQNIVPNSERDDFMRRLQGYKNGRAYRQRLPQP